MRYACFALLAVISAFLFALASIADDRDEPSDRKTCGRLVISIVGAGECAKDPNQKENETVRADRHEAEAIRHLVQFTGGNDAILSSKHIVITSDPDLKAFVKRLPFSRKVALAGVVDNSIPAFARMVDPASKDSPLNQAILDFKNDNACRQLMRKSDDVTPFLKVDIIVDGEYAYSEENSRYCGISSFKKEGTVGTFDLWMIHHGTVIGKEELSQFMRRLSGSLVHVFVKTCKAGLIGNMFDSAMDETGACGCYVGVANEEQIHYSGGEAPSAPFNYAMPRQGGDMVKADLRQSFGKWTSPNRSMISMSAALLDQHEPMILFLGNDFRSAASGFAQDHLGRDLEFLSSFSCSRNPLFGFGYTSADALTNKALALLQKNPSTADQAKQLADSEFSSEMRQISIKPYETGANDRVDSDVARIRSLLTEARSQLGTLIDDEAKAKLDPTVYDREIKNFCDCILNSSPAPAFCSTIKDSINEVNGKLTQNAALSPDEIIFHDGYGSLMLNLKDKDLEYIIAWQKYLSDEISLKDFLSRMGAARLAFRRFKRNIEPLCKKSLDEQPREQRELWNNRRQALDYLASCLERALDSTQSQIFEYLKKETVTTKLTKTEAAVNLLAANLNAIEPRGTGEQLIADMARKLTCLTRYPVGPAHDRNKPGPTLTISHD